MHLPILTVTIESIHIWLWRYHDFRNNGELPFSQSAFNALDSLQQASEYARFVPANQSSQRGEADH